MFSSGLLGMSHTLQHSEQPNVMILSVLICATTVVFCMLDISILFFIPELIAFQDTEWPQHLLLKYVINVLLKFLKIYFNLIYNRYYIYFVINILFKDL